MNYTTLKEANTARQKLWDPENKLGVLYRSNELGGEVGEALNVVKKLERERLGIKGSRDTKEHLAEELADVIICTSLTALAADIDLDQAVIDKFNKTSDAVGFDIKLVSPDFRLTGEWIDFSEPKKDHDIFIDEGVLAEAAERAYKDMGKLMPKISGAAFNILGHHMVHHISDVLKEWKANDAKSVESNS